MVSMFDCITFSLEDEFYKIPSLNAQSVYKLSSHSGTFFRLNSPLTNLIHNNDKESTRSVSKVGYLNVQETSGKV